MEKTTGFIREALITTGPEVPAAPVHIADTLEASGGFR